MKCITEAMEGNVNKENIKNFNKNIMDNSAQRQRNRIDLFTKEEKAIWDVNQMIENMPHAHPLLTECQILLDQAKDKLSDWVDMTQNGGANG